MADFLQDNSHTDEQALSAISGFMSRTAPLQPPPKRGITEDIATHLAVGANKYLAMPIAGITEIAGRATGIKPLENAGRSFGDNAESWIAQKEQEDPSQKFRDISNAGDAARWAGEQMLEFAPQAVIGLATGGAGAAAGRVAAGGLARAGITSIEGIAGKKAVQAAVTNTGRSLTAKELGGLAADRSGTAGAIAATGAGSVGMETSTIYRDQKPEEKDMGRALLFGTAAGILDTAFPAYLMKKTGLTKIMPGMGKISGEAEALTGKTALAGVQRVKDTVKVAGLGIGEETIQEGVQTVLENIGANKQVYSDEVNKAGGNFSTFLKVAAEKGISAAVHPEAWNDIIESMAAGGLIGGVMGGGSSAAGHVSDAMQQRAQGSPPAIASQTDNLAPADDDIPDFSQQQSAVAGATVLNDSNADLPLSPVQKPLPVLERALAAGGITAPPVSSSQVSADMYSSFATQPFANAPQTQPVTAALPQPPNELERAIEWRNSIVNQGNGHLLNGLSKASYPDYIISEYRKSQTPSGTNTTPGIKEKAGGITDILSEVRNQGPSQVDGQRVAVPSMQAEVSGVGSNNVQSGGVSDDLSSVRQKVNGPQKEVPSVWSQAVTDRVTALKQEKEMLLAKNSGKGITGGLVYPAAVTQRLGEINTEIQAAVKLQKEGFENRPDIVSMRERMHATENNAERAAIQEQIAKLRFADQQPSDINHQSSAKVSVQPSTIKARRQLDSSKDSLAVAIAKLGGVSRTEIDNQTGTGKDLAHTLNSLATKEAKAGILHVISPKGMPLDKMRESLVEQGYLDESADINTLLDKLDSASRGIVHRSTHSSDVGADAYREAEIRYSEMINAMTDGEYDEFSRNQWLDEQAQELADAGDILNEYLDEVVDAPMSAADWSAIEDDFKEAIDATEFSTGNSTEDQGQVQEDATSEAEGVSAVSESDAASEGTAGTGKTTAPRPRPVRKNTFADDVQEFERRQINLELNKRKSRSESSFRTRNEFHQNEQKIKELEKRLKKLPIGMLTASGAEETIYYKTPDDPSYQKRLQIWKDGMDFEILHSKNLDEAYKDFSAARKAPITREYFEKRWNELWPSKITRDTDAITRARLEARADGWKYDTSDDLDSIGWYKGKYEIKLDKGVFTAVTKLKEPNKTFMSFGSAAEYLSSSDMMPVAKPEKTSKALEDLTDEEFANLPEVKIDHPVLAALKESSEPNPTRQPTANTIFTEDAYLKAKAIMKAKLEGQLNAGIDPELMNAGFTVAGYHIEKGARSFVAFAKAMVEDLGETIRPYLKSFYNGVRDLPGVEHLTKEMDDYQHVSAIDVNNLEKPSNSAIIEPAAIGGTTDDQRSGSTLEPDSGKRNPENSLGKEDVQSRSGTTESGVGKRVRAVRETRDSIGRSDVLPRSETAVTGERSNQSVHSEPKQSGLADSITGNLLSERSGDTGVAGTRLEPVSAKAVDGTATRLPDLVRKITAQKAAQDVKVIRGDRDNIEKSLPFLLPGQRDDVKFAEDRFDKPTGYGVLFTNGTGTGKTYTGLGIIKRLERKGKRNILIVTPNTKIINDWAKSGKNLQLDITPLKDTKDSGTDITITTYANFGANDTLAKRQWDAVVFDESHTLNSNKDGNASNAHNTMQAITLHPDGAYNRARMLNPGLWQKSDEIREAMKTKGLSKEAVQKMDTQLKAVFAQQDAARQKVRDEVTAAQGTDKRPRVVFLSATPFAYDKNIQYANGYLFDWNEGQSKDQGGRGYNGGDNYQRFMMTHFGYIMKYNKLQEPGAEVDRGVMQRQFNSWLKSQGVLSGRALDSDYDYDRKFVLIDSAVGQQIDEGLTWLRDRQNMRPVEELINKRFDYLSRRYLLEAIKAKESVPYIKEQLALGRKVVVFHDYNKGGGFSPFDLSQHQDSDHEVSWSTDKGQNTAPLGRLVREFMAARPDLVSLPLKNLHSPIITLGNAFPDLLLFNGTIPAKERINNIDLFQADDSKHNIILVQSDAGGAGISLHDTTGKHQRLLINLGLPVKPTMAIQQEGRIYRVGQASNAMFRYFNTGTSWERYAFASSIARKTSGAENLAAGDTARMLMDAFVQGFEESDSYPAGHEGEGTGGKERDRAANAALTEYDKALTHYWATQKKTSRNKAAEGVDYFATPEPIGYKMAEWADVANGESELEPSGGHAAIARYFNPLAKRRMVEPSMDLASRAGLVFDGDIIQGRFEDHNIVNKYDAIVMNPPFGSGGKTAIEHLEKAARHLKDKGRIVALLPDGPTANKRLEKFLYEGREVPVEPLYTDTKLGPIYQGDTISFSGIGSIIPASTKVVGHIDDNGASWFVREKGEKKEQGVNLVAADSVEPTGPRTKAIGSDLHLLADITLPQVTFNRAGTSVSTHIVILDKGREDTSHQIHRDYSDITDIKELFDRLRDASIPERERTISNGSISNDSPAVETQDPAPQTKPQSADGFKIFQFDRTDTGVTTYGANLTERVDKNAYTKVAQRAKKYGGYYSKFNKGTARPGFLFKTEAARNEFVDTQATKNVQSEASFKLSNADATGFKATEAQAWASTLPIAKRVNIVQSVDDLPEAARAEITAAQVNPSYVQAMELHGTIHVISDNVPDLQRVKALVIGHELAHAGQTKKVVDLAVDWFKRTVNGKTEAAKEAHFMLQRVADRYGYDLTDEKQYRRAVQEATAAIAEQAVNADWKPAGLMPRLFMYIKHWLRQQGLISHVSDSELSLAVAEMLRIGEKRLSVGLGGNEAQFATSIDNIESVLSQASSLGNSNVKAIFGKVSDWLSGEAEKVGLEISNFTHVIDTSAVRHIRKEHGDIEKEIKRGQLGITDEDIKKLPEVIAEPDSVAFGTRNKIGRDQIVYLKKLEDGTTLYFEEIRTGKRELAAVTVRKYPATMNAASILATLDLNAQGDDGNSLIIIDRPQMSSGSAHFALADQAISQHAAKINAPAKVTDMVKSLIELAGQSIPERLKANIGKILSNPWFGSEGKPTRRHVVNLNLERSQNRNGIISDLFQASEGYTGVEGLDNILKKASKEELKQFNDIIKHGDENEVAKTFTRDELYRGKTKFGKVGKTVVEAYKAFHEVMQAANRVRFQQLDELSMLPYKDQEWFADLVELLNKNMERAANLDAKEANEVHRLIRSLKRNLTDDELASGENPAKIKASPAVIAAYRDFWKQVDQTEKKHQGNMLSAFRDILGYRGELDKLKNQWGNLRGYAPRNRKDGDWHVSVYTTNEEGERVKVYMKPTLTETGAKSLVREVQTDLKKHLKGNFEAGITYEVEYERNNATPSELLAWKGSEVAVEALLNQAFDRAGVTGKMSVEQWQSLKHEVFQEIAKEIMAQGFGRHGISREATLIEGYEDTDYQTVLKEYISGMSGWLSKMRFAIETTSAAKDISKADPSDKVWVNDYVQDAMKNSTYLDELAATARSVGAVYYLGFKVSSALLNAFQNYTVGQAELSLMMKKAGHKGSAIAALATAQKDVMKDWGDRARGGKGSLTTEEHDVLFRAVREGTAQAQAIRQISGTQEMGFGTGWKKFTELSMTPFQFVEQRLNREPAILAAYRIFKKSAAGTIDEAAYKQAETFVNNTHYVMGKENLPEMVRKLGPLGKTVYLFQGYVHNYIHWMFNRAKEGEFATIARSLGAIAALGGVFALPGADDLDSWIMKWFGVSYKMKFKKFVKDTAGNSTPGQIVQNFVNHGVTSVAGVDMSRALAVNIPFISDPEKTFGERIGGAWGGLLKKPGMALNAANKGDYVRAVENLLPEFAANPMRAARQYNQGATTLSGKPIFDETGHQVKYSGSDVTKKMLGFNPLEISDRTNLKSDERDLNAYWKSERDDALAAIRRAKNADDMKAAVRGVVKYNTELRKSQAFGLVPIIKAESIQRSRTFKPQKKTMSWERNQID